MSEIKSCDSLEILVLVDNCADAMFSSANPRNYVEQIPTGINCLGEHGLALYLTVKKDEKEFHVLFDTGSVHHSILHNWNKLMNDPATINALVISHGHFDHWGSILEVLDHISNIPVYFHEDIGTLYKASRDQAIQLPSDELDKKVLRKLRREFNLVDLKINPPLERVLEKIKERKCSFNPVNGLTELFPGVYTSGDVERKYDFELANKFLSNRTGTWNIADFQEEVQMYINVRDRGLVVLSGCGHVGILNIIEHGKKITGISKILGVIGGFHLFKISQERINETLSYFQKENPAVVAPMHCTGEDFYVLNYNAMPEVVANACVGTKFHF